VHGELRSIFWKVQTMQVPAQPVSTQLAHNEHPNEVVSASELSEKLLGFHHLADE
jgi:hypothetical protein